MSKPWAAGRPPGPSAIREIVVAGGALLALVAGGLWWAGSPGGPAPPRKSSLVRGAPGFVGSRACAECHPGEAAHFSRSGHARTLRPAGKSKLADWLVGREADDPEDPAARWSFEAGGDQLIATRKDGRTGRVDRLPLGFAFGSGTHATTFVSLEGAPGAHPRGVEHRLSVFADGPRIVVTPGQRADAPSPGCSPLGRSLNELETRKCFECHTTRLSAHDPETLDAATLIPNVSCERCHGPGRAHVDAARRGVADLAMPFGPDRWTADSQLRMCGHCHRLPEFVPEPKRVPENPVLVRFQTVGLMESRCYRESRSALSCVTCHDPHARTSHDRTRYEDACRSCHEGPGRVPCAIAKAGGCIDCHMPRRDSGEGLEFSDHWIRRKP